MMHLLIPFITVIGLLIGSFLNVCIHRIPCGETVVTKPSHCPQCMRNIKWHDLVPVISYIWLKGQCRYCCNKISIIYPLVELLNAVAYLWLYSTFGLSVSFAGFALLTSALIVISFIDLKHKIIPDSILILLFIVGVIYNIINPELTILNSALGFFAVSVPLFILALITNGGMGGGDIKLMAVVGIFLGWKLVLISLFIASLLGSIVGISLMLFKQIKRKEHIPFGPFLAAGIFIAILYGNMIWDWYLGQY